MKAQLSSQFKRALEAEVRRLMEQGASEAKPPLNTYIANMRSALNSSGARSLYFPMDRAKRKQGNLRLARELGYGLKDYPEQDVKRILGELYGKMVAANSFDSVGVAIDAGPWNRELLRAAGF